MAASSVSLKEYLKKYQSEADDKTKKKKKKKKPNINPIGSGVLVFDEDPVWQKPVQIEDPDDEDSADEVPQVDEDIEVKRMRRLEAIRSRKPYHSISDDGSGWVSVSDQPMGANSDLSPPRTRRARFDSPSPEREVKAEPDLLPMRQRRRRADTPSPVREVNADRDLSPPRQRGRLADTLSPVQEVKVEPDLSPQPQRRRCADMPMMTTSCHQEGMEIGRRMPIFLRLGEVGHDWWREEEMVISRRLEEVEAGGMVTISLRREAGCNCLMVIFCLREGGRNPWWRRRQTFRLRGGRKR